MNNGKVILVGAGPGDAGLLTVKGKQAVETADVVVYDRLVGKDILALIPQNAEKINAGKSSSNHLIPQSEINKILLEKALEGKSVVRLKGGDCFLFGRGGEELELLYENGIEFEVVPGISSSTAVPAYAGIPVTHRDCASSVHIITGHAREGRNLEIDFESCVKSGGTLVFLMGVANLKYIADGLINAGMDTSMPCAVIENGTRGNQKKYLTHLESLAEDAAQAKSPSIIIVGRVCELSEKFDWFSKRPLHGIGVMVTRPKERSGKLSDMLRQRGAEVYECSCIRTVSDVAEDKIDEIAESIEKHDWVVFTSPSGVKIAFDALLKFGLDARVFGGKYIAAVGSATGDELLKYGIRADMMPSKYNGSELGEMLSFMVGENESVLLLRADKTGPELTDCLENNHINYTDLSIYHTEYVVDKEAFSPVENGLVKYVTFTSASTVRGFAANTDCRDFTGVCIGEMTAQEAKKHGINCIVSDESDLQSMIICIERSLDYINETGNIKSNGD